MNIETLKPFENGSNAIENGRKGGLKSVEERRKKKLFKEVVKDLLNQKPTDDEIKELLKQYPSLEIEDITLRTSIIDKQIKRALKGDTKASEFILNMSGEKPKDNELSRELTIIKVDLID